MAAVLRPEAAYLVVANLLGYGVRRAELAVDRATGVVLRIQTTDDDRQPLHRLEAHSVRFDAAVDDGSTPTGEIHGGPVTLQQAAHLVPFTLYAPPTTPADYPWSALARPDRPGHPVTVTPVGHLPGHAGRARRSDTSPCRHL